MINVSIEGLESVSRFLESFPEATKRAAHRAINQTADRKGFAAMRALMKEQIAFPPGYLEDQTRFRVGQRATSDNLEATVVARQRPTSLARFVSNRGAIGRTGPAAPLIINVKKNRRKTLQRAFLIRLRAGQSASADNFNVGLAVRLAAGETLINKKFARPMQGNLYLLYGPSVEQLFENLLPSKMGEIGEYLETEFLRQMNLELLKV